MRIVVGGEIRKAGKTTVVCRIVAAFPEAEWTVVKVTPHLHGGEGAWTLHEDEAGGDTRRYKEAGAHRALLYCGDIEAGLGRLLEELGKARNWIVETTSAARLIEHDLAILVTAEQGAEAKASAEGFPGACVRVRADEGEIESIVSGCWKA